MKPAVSKVIGSRRISDHYFGPNKHCRDEMEGKLIILAIVLLGMVLSAVSALANHLRNRKRRDVMSKFAEHQGLEYYQTGDSDLMHRMVAYRLFSRGRAKVIKNLVYGSSDNEVICLFDYHFTVGSGKSQSTIWQTVMAIESDSLSVPAMLVHPVKFMQRTTAPRGMQQIKLDRHPDFKEHQILFAENQEQIETFFDDPTSRELADNQLHVETTPGRMIIYSPKKLVPADKLSTFMTEGFARYRLFAERASQVG